jgi:patatin-related protein
VAGQGEEADVDGVGRDPVGPDTQELRIATAMTGGVSLAVWMGGVARELNLLHQASRVREAAGAAGTGDQVASDGRAAPDDHVRGLYRALLDLLDMTITVDVLSGTSAGGINAAVLGLAHARSLDLGPLRELWLTAGAFDTLLLDPAAKDPRSLLQGDAVLLAKLREGFEMLAGTRYPAGGGNQPETTIFVTTTLLAGETGRFTDDYGTLVPDVDHRGLFTFETSQLVSTDPDCLASLALAARSSASFPAAFEPAFLPFSRPHHGEVPSGELDMKEFANITRPHWAADGGLLMNRPIAPLLQTIFDRPVQTVRQVRRVLLYVVPSPGQPDPNANPEVADNKAPLTLPDALIKDLDALLSQSIATELTAIRRHNDQVDALRDTRRHLAELGIALRGATPTPRDHGGRLASAAMLDDYRVRQGESVARQVVRELMRAITSLDSDDIPSLWKQALAPAGNGQPDADQPQADQRRVEYRNAEQRCRDAAARKVAEGCTRLPDPADVAALASFGRPAYEAAEAFALDLLRSAFVVAEDAGQRQQLARYFHQVSTIVEFQQPSLRTMVHEAVTGAGNGPKPLEEAAADLTLKYVEALATPVPSAERQAKSLEAAWAALAGVVIDARPILKKLADAPHPDGGGDGDDHQLRPTTLSGRRRLAEERLATYLRYLGPGRDPATVQVRMFDLYLAERGMLPVEAVAEQRVELIQLSANTRTALAPRRSTAEQKLTGVQLHHFGAFYKSSWRANDWMWGRLDGAGWLVHLLLDPRRIYTITHLTGRGRSPSATEWFYGELKQRIGGQDPDFLSVDSGGKQVVVDAEAVKRELAFLEGPTEEFPVSLPMTSMWVGAALQRWIAAAELPVVAREMLVNPSPDSSGWPEEVLRRADDMTAATEIARAVVAAPGDGTTQSAADLLAKVDAPRLAREIATQLAARAKRGDSTLATVKDQLQRRQLRQTSLELARTIMQDFELARVLARSPAAASDVAGVLTKGIEDELARRKTTSGGGDRLPSVAEVGRAQATKLTEEQREQPDRLDLGGLDRRATQLASQLASCPVPAEKLPDQAGTPLFTKTATKAVAVATAAMTNLKQPPAVLKPVMTSARTVTLTGYRATGVTGGRARGLIGAGCVLLAAGVVLAIQRAVLLGLTGVVLALTGAYLVVLGTWGVRRRAVPALLAVAFLALLALPWLPFVRDWVFGGAGCPVDSPGCQGYVARRIVPWLREQRFPLLVPGVVLLVVAAAAAWWGYSAGRRRIRVGLRRGGTDD